MQNWRKLISDQGAGESVKESSSPTGSLRNRRHTGTKASAAVCSQPFRAIFFSPVSPSLSLSARRGGQSGGPFSQAVRRPVFRCAQGSFRFCLGDQHGAAALGGCGADETLADPAGDNGPARVDPLPAPRSQLEHPLPPRGRLGHSNDEGKMKEEEREREEEEEVESSAP